MKVRNIKNFDSMVALDVSSISDREWQSLLRSAISFPALKGLVTDLVRKQIKADPWFCKSLENLLFNEDIDYTLSNEIDDLDPIDLEDVESMGEFEYEIEVPDIDFKLIVKEKMELDGDEKIWVPKEVKLEII